MLQGGCLYVLAACFSAMVWCPCSFHLFEITFFALQRSSLVLSPPKPQVHPRTNPHRNPPASHQTAKTSPQLVIQVHQQMLTAGRIATSMLAQVVEMVLHQPLSAGMGQIAAAASNLIKMGQNNALIAGVMAGRD